MTQAAVVHARYTDDGCYLYVYTCCRYEYEGRTPPGNFCPGCGQRIEKSIIPHVNKRYWIPPKPQPGWLLEETYIDDEENYQSSPDIFYLGDRASALLARKIIAKYGRWSSTLRSMEEADERFKDEEDDLGCRFEYRLYRGIHKNPW